MWGGVFNVWILSVLKCLGYVSVFSVWMDSVCVHPVIAQEYRATSCSVLVTQAVAAVFRTGSDSLAKAQIELVYMNFVTGRFPSAILLPRRP